MDKLDTAAARALLEWLKDFDEGWGDRGENQNHEEGGYAQLDHGDGHDQRIFNLIRTARACMREEGR